MPAKKIQPAPSAKTSAASSRASSASGVVSSRASAIAPATADSGEWQDAHDKLEAAFETASNAFSQARDKDQRAVLRQTILSLSNQITKLDLEDIHNRTIDLEAASGQLDTGIAELVQLKAQLAAIAHDFAVATDVINGIDSAISGLKSFLATFAI